MDNEEKLFRKLARRSFKEASERVATLWPNYIKADRIRNYEDPVFMDNLLAPLGWTDAEYKEELKRQHEINYFT